MKTVSQARSHGGVQSVHTHASEACACDMTFAAFVPPQAKDRKLPVISAFMEDHLRWHAARLA